MRTLTSILLAIALLFVTVPSLGLIQPIPAAKAASCDLECQKNQAAAQVKQKQALAAAEAAEAARIAKQIDNAQAQIDQLQGSISNTQQDLANTQQQIEEQNQQIAGLESDLRKIKEKQDALVRQLYIMTVSMPDEMVFLSNESISERERFEARYSKLKESVANLYQITTEKKMAVEKTRADLKARSDQLAQLRDQQTEQQNGLATFESIQAAAKQNHEAAVAQYTAEAKAAQLQLARIEAQISAALTAAIGAARGSGTRVSRGTVIGHRGSTGYSTGPHVHFEVRVGNTPVDPTPYVSNGTLGWPVSNFVITQGFGWTDYAQGGAYGGAMHTGLDLAGPYGDPVVASCNGYIILDQYYGGYGNAVAVKCDGNNLTVLDGHMTGR